AQRCGGGGARLRERQPADDDESRREHEAKVAVGTLRRRAASQFRLQDGCHVSLANQSNLLLQQHSEIVNLTAALSLENPSQHIEWSLVQSRKAPDNPTMVAASMRLN